MREIYGLKEEQTKFYQELRQIASEKLFLSFSERKYLLI